MLQRTSIKITLINDMYFCTKACIKCSSYYESDNVIYYREHVTLQWLVSNYTLDVTWCNVRKTTICFVSLAFLFFIRRLCMHKLLSPIHMHVLIRFSMCQE